MVLLFIILIQVLYVEKYFNLIFITFKHGPRHIEIGKNKCDFFLFFSIFFRWIQTLTFIFGLKNESVPARMLTARIQHQISLR